MKENSREEAIETMKHWIEYEKANKEKINKADELISIQETILSDYKRVLKENEILKEEKSQAWEEWNNLEQGSYETEQKLQQQIKELQKENKELKEYIAIAPNLYEMTATKYRNIQQDAYVQGRAEEQQKAEQIIHENYISIQKIKDKIEKLNKIEQDLQNSISKEARGE